MFRDFLTRNSISTIIKYKRLIFFYKINFNILTIYFFFLVAMRAILNLNGMEIRGRKRKLGGKSTRAEDVSSTQQW